MAFSLIARFALSLSLLATFRVCPISGEDVDRPPPLEPDMMVVDEQPPGSALNCDWSIGTVKAIKQAPDAAVVDVEAVAPALIHLGDMDDRWRVWVSQDNELVSFTFTEARAHAAAREQLCRLQVTDQWTLCRGDASHLIAATPTSSSNKPALDVAFDDTTEVDEPLIFDGNAASLALPWIFWHGDATNEIEAIRLPNQVPESIQWAGDGGLDISEGSAILMDDALCLVADHGGVGRLESVIGDPAAGRLDSTHFIDADCLRPRLHAHADTGRLFAVCSEDDQLAVFTSDDCREWVRGGLPEPVPDSFSGSDEDDRSPSRPAIVSVQGGGILAAWSTNWPNEGGSIRVAEFDADGSLVAVREVEGGPTTPWEVALAPSARADQFGLVWLDTRGAPLEPKIALVGCGLDAD